MLLHAVFGAVRFLKRVGAGLMQGSYERHFFKRCLRKTGKKVDNQLKMIQKGLLLSCSYSRSVKLLPEATHDKCPSRCLNLYVNLYNDIGDIRFALHPRSSRLDKKQFLQSIFFADRLPRSYFKSMATTTSSSRNPFTTGLEMRIIRHVRIAP